MKKNIAIFFMLLLVITQPTTVHADLKDWSPILTAVIGIIGLASFCSHYCFPSIDKAQLQQQNNLKTQKFVTFVLQLYKASCDVTGNMQEWEKFECDFFKADNHTKAQLFKMVGAKVAGADSSEVQIATDWLYVNGYNEQNNK